MKKYSPFLFFMLFFSAAAIAQLQDENYMLDFEDPITLSNLNIDSISNPGNVWKTGIPQKNSFTIAYSTPNVIVTDIADPYPVNDTSSFTVTTIMSSLSIHEYMGIRGHYWVNSDTLTDYGKIEVSFNNSTSWINLMDDSVIFNYGVIWNSYPDQGPSVLTGNSNGWLPFEVEIQQLFILNNVETGDTTLYRFTFISDENQTGKDGLMFDDLYPYNATLLGLNEPLSEFSISVFPNPVNDYFFINSKDMRGRNAELSILDLTGRKLLDKISMQSLDDGIDVSNLPSGEYFYKVVDVESKMKYIGKFIKN